MTHVTATNLKISINGFLFIFLATLYDIYI